MTSMVETDFQADLNAVNNQLTTLVEELNKIQQQIILRLQI